MKFALAIGLLFSMSAFANDGFDFRSGGPHGGKFCHYRISQCEQNDCVAAAECAIKEYSNQVSWDEVKNIKLFRLNANTDVLTFTTQTKDGPTLQDVTVEKGSEGCKPVALKKY